MTDYTDLKRRLEEPRAFGGYAMNAEQTMYERRLVPDALSVEAAAAIAALEAEVARLRDARIKSSYHTGFADGLRHGLAAASLAQQNPNA